MNLDITFCSNLNCKNMECERNQNNLIKHSLIKLYKYGEIELKHPISMANFEKCEFWEVENE